jgi:predicted ester cyclase
MRAGENKALVRRFLDAVAGGWSPAVIEEFFAPEYRRHLTPTTPPITAEAQLQRALRLGAAFRDRSATLEDIVAEGDRVAFRLTIRGTHEKTFLGIPPTGRPIAVSFLGIVRIAEGKLVEEWGGLDQGDLFRQLGVSPIRDA